MFGLARRRHSQPNRTVAPAGAPTRHRTPAVAALLAAALTAAVPLAAQAAGPLTPASTPASAPVAASSSAARTDQVLVTWRAATAVGTTATGADAIAANATRVAALSRAAGQPLTFVRTALGNASVYRLPHRLGADADRIVAALSKVGGVAHVEPDYWMTTETVPNDTLASSLWGLLSVADGGSPYGVDAESAWPITTGAGVTVAVIDTGFLYTHEDLQGIAPAGYGYDMVAGSNSADGDGRDADPSDPGDWSDGTDCTASNSSWHGSHVAGTIAALENNAKGVFGGAYGVRIEPVRVLGTCGGYDSDISDGIAWASGATVAGVPANLHPARVLNLSLGGQHACSTVEQTAIDTARANNSVVVVAAGNSNLDASQFAPASCNGVITVAATDVSGKKASFSNYGPLVEIAGPGVAIKSTINSGLTTPVTTAGGSIYADYSGTSMATPHVVLSAALVAAAFPSLTPDGIAAALEATTTPVAADGTANSCQTRGCGVGVVNVKRALDALAGTAPLVAMVTAAAPLKIGANLTVTAGAVDATKVASAQYRFDSGAWAAMTATGGFGTTFAALTATAPEPTAAGVHQVCVRATDADVSAHTSDGTTCAAFTVLAPPTAAIPTLATSPAAAGAAVRVTSTVAQANVAIAGASISVDGATVGLAAALDTAFDSPSEQAVGLAGATAVRLATTYNTTCAITSAGDVACWGAGSNGNIGDGATANRRVPIVVNVGGPAVDIATSTTHTCAVRADGHAACWGWITNGALGTGNNSLSLVPAAVTGVTTATAAVTGVGHSCLLLGGGSVVCFGADVNGELGDGGNAARNAPVATGITNAVAIAAGDSHTCAALADGTVKCWGANASGQLGNNSTTLSNVPVTVAGITDAIGIAASATSSCALRAGGRVSCWGNNSAGQLGDGTTTPRPTPVAVAPGTELTSLEGGDNFYCGTSADRGLVCWGANDSAQLGIAAGASRTSPVVGAATGIIAVAGGRSHACAILAGGGISCWGWDGIGQFGDGRGTGTPTAAPVATEGFGVPLAPGSHQVCVTATDAGTNVSVPSCATLTITTTKPGAPLGVTATAAAGTATLSWSPPANLGGSAITSYTVTSTPPVTCPVSGAATTCTATGLANGTVYAFTVHASNAQGAGPASAPVRVVPSTGGSLTVTLATGTIGAGATASVPVRLAWKTGLEPLASAETYQVEARVGAAPWGLSSSAAPTASILVPPGTASFRARSTRGLGTSGWVGVSGVVVGSRQNTASTVNYGGSWTSATSATAYGGSLRYASSAKRTVATTFAGRAIAWVSSRGPNMGNANVLLDGKVVATVSLYAATAAPRAIVFATALKAGSHTLTIVVLGTKASKSTGKRVDFDGFLTLK